MTDLVTAIRMVLAQQDAAPGVVDLYVVAATLRPQFPDRSAEDLMLNVARVAAQDGYRYFVWSHPRP